MNITRGSGTENDNLSSLKLPSKRWLAVSASDERIGRNYISFLPTFGNGGLLIRELSRLERFESCNSHDLDLPRLSVLIYAIPHLSIKLIVEELRIGRS